MEHVNVLIVGAGISGIGAACHLQQKCPHKSFAIVEGRDNIGGTWDLFKYPGIRSDSDMYTLGYRFKPWTHTNAIADAADILDYLKETVAEHAIGPHIRFGHQVVAANWSSADAKWRVEMTPNGSVESTFITCNFLHMCSGYYNYAEGYTPDFPGRSEYQGNFIHPQHWPEDLDYAGRKVLIIGSGATAVTLVPAMAKTASHVTMLQRSPTYVVSRPAIDTVANALRRLLPDSWAYFLVRWRNILLQRLVYDRCQRHPEKAKEFFLNMVRKEMGPGYDVDTHFNPSYGPWDQRLCLVPDSDLFKAIRSGAASIETDQIDTFTTGGVRLKSGKELQADIVVSATGLKLQFLSDVRISVDGKLLEPSKAISYKGMMLSDVPNLAISMGYTNASWTLKCDLTCDYVCRLLNHMDKHGYSSCVPATNGVALSTVSYMDLSAGYVQRAQGLLPQQGEGEPWRMHQNYIKDIFTLRYSSLEDKAMEFS